MAASFPASAVNLVNNNTFTGDLGSQINAIHDEIEAVETNLLCSTQALTADGAITIKAGIVTLSKGSALAATLAAPAAADNGKILTVYSLTAQAHTVTITGSAGATATDVATFGAAIGNCITLRAYGEKWYNMGALGVTVA